MVRAKLNLISIFCQSRRETHHPCVVDENVQPVVFSEEGISSTFYGGEGGDVKEEKLDVGVGDCRFDFGDCFVCFRFRASAHVERMGIVFGELEDCFFAETAVASGDYYYFARKVRDVSVGVEIDFLAHLVDL